MNAFEIINYSRPLIIMKIEIMQLKMMCIKILVGQITHVK